MSENPRADDREIDRGYMRDFVVRLRFAGVAAPREFMVRSTTVRGALSRAIETEEAVVSGDDGRLIGADVSEVTEFVGPNGPSVPAG